MRVRRRRRGRIIPALVACFYAGIAVGWLLHAAFTPDPAPPARALADVPLEPRVERPSRQEHPAVDIARIADPTDAIETLRSRRLRLPLDDVDPEDMAGGFDQPRGPNRRHQAVDLIAPRHTPIHAVDDGTIARLIDHRTGGLSIYQRDWSGRFIYYYAHLQRYAPGLHEGQHVRAGDVVGLVGTTGNAPPDTPHLHFAILEQPDPRRWSGGRAIDPYLVFQP